MLVSTPTDAPVQRDKLRYCSDQLPHPPPHTENDHGEDFAEVSSSPSGSARLTVTAPGTATER